VKVKASWKRPRPEFGCRDKGKEKDGIKAFSTVLSHVHWSNILNTCKLTRRHSDANLSWKGASGFCEFVFKILIADNLMTFSVTQATSVK
jgi:hypothetical protein